MPLPIFGHSLADLRRKRGLSQKRVALDAGLDQSYLAGMERGRRAPPRGPILERIFRALDATEEERRSVRRAHALNKLTRELAGDDDFCDAVLRVAESLEHFTPEDLRNAATNSVGMIGTLQPSNSHGASTKVERK